MISFMRSPFFRLTHLCHFVNGHPLLYSLIVFVIGFFFSLEAFCNFLPFYFCKLQVHWYLFISFPHYVLLSLFLFICFLLIFLSFSLYFPFLFAYPIMSYQLVRFSFCGFILVFLLFHSGRLYSVPSASIRSVFWFTQAFISFDFLDPYFLRSLIVAFSRGCVFLFSSDGKVRHSPVPNPRPCSWLLFTTWNCDFFFVDNIFRESYNLLLRFYFGT